MVSVIMGTYNGSNTIVRAVQSILNQTYKDFELIICDDASKDDTYQLLVNLSKQDSRINIIHNGKNLKLAASLNKCLELARGELIARMDDDDISHPDRLEKQVIYMEEHSDIAFCGTGADYFDDISTFGKNMRKVDPQLIDVYKASQFIHPTVMIRKTALLAVDGYTISPLTQRCEDYDLWCKLYYQKFKGHNLSECLFDYYESEESMLKRKKIHRYELYKIKKYWRKQFSLNFLYDIYAYIDLMKIAIPNKFILKHHRNKMK